MSNLSIDEAIQILGSPEGSIEPFTQPNDANTLHTMSLNELAYSAAVRALTGFEARLGDDNHPDVDEALRASIKTHKQRMVAARQSMFREALRNRHLFDIIEYREKLYAALAL